MNETFTAANDAGLSQMSFSNPRESARVLL